MILSDAIIIDVEDARHLCDAIQLVLRDKRLKKQMFSEHTEAYHKLHNLVQEMDERKRSVENMADTIRDIQRTINPDPIADD